MEIVTLRFLRSIVLFFVTNKGQWNAKSGPNVADGNVAMRKKIRDVLSRNEIVRAEIGQILHTHIDTHTHAAKLVVRS